MITAWIFAIFWNVLSGFLPFIVYRELVEKGNKPALLALIFPVIGAGLLIWAMRATLRYRTFGVSVFRLAQVPGVIGRKLHGVIITNAHVLSDDGFHLTLTCLNRIVTRSGKDTKTREKVLWQEMRAVRQISHVGRRATGIPVSFRVPSDARESDDREPDNRIIWRLEARAAVPGVDYYVAFEVPVFRTAESDEPLPLDADEEPAASEEFRQPPDSRIYVTDVLRRTEIFFSPARNLGAAIGVMVFAVAWIAITVALPRLGAPIIFPIAFGLTSLLLLYMVYALWLKATRVVLTASSVDVTSGPFALGRTRSIRAANVEDIVFKIGMQSGTRAFYDIQVIHSGGRKTYAGSSIRDKREVEWLVELMRDRLLGTEK
jgi:hypothetical protein